MYVILISMENIKSENKRAYGNAKILIGQDRVIQCDPMKRPQCEDGFYPSYSNITLNTKQLIDRLLF